MKLSANWKLALTLDAAGAFAAYVLWSRGIVNDVAGLAIIITVAMLAALLTHGPR